MDYGVETIKQQTRTAYGCLVAGSKSCILNANGLWAVCWLCVI